jgi:hypothetical protein
VSQEPHPLAVIVPVIATATSGGVPWLAHLVKLAFQPRHQVFGGLQPRLLLAQADVSLSDALLCRLMFPAAMVRLLLHGATVRYFSLRAALRGCSK